MTTPYFAQFPTVKYKNTTCVDVTRRVKLTEETRNALTLYYNYEVKNGSRADVITAAYYDDSTLDWLLWLTNDVVDPYYQWNLSIDDFNGYLVKKYGSIENSIKRIACYRNNWYDDDQILTPSFYDNHLDESLRKYYQPFYDKNTKVVYWQRRQEDWTMETNMIYELYNDNALQFQVGELVDVNDFKHNRVGGGEITNISTHSIFIKNIDGAFEVDQRIVAETTKAEANITYVRLAYAAITLDEGVFWSPATYYDLENEKNTYNRSIRILDTSHVTAATESVRNLLKV